MGFLGHVRGAKRWSRIVVHSLGMALLGGVWWAGVAALILSWQVQVPQLRKAGVMVLALCLAIHLVLGLRPFRRVYHFVTPPRRS